jgi:hypothetical protein
MYWEVYGLSAGEPARVELTVAPVIDSTIHPMDVRAVGVAWETQAAPSLANEGGWAQGFILDVATLKPGRHHMMVTIVVPGEEPVTVVREIKVVVGG